MFKQEWLWLQKSFYCIWYMFIKFFLSWNVFAVQWTISCELAEGLNGFAQRKEGQKPVVVDKMTLVLLVLLSCVLRQVDTNSKNVFGQPRLRASLRDLRSPRRTYKSTIEDDLKKLIIMDNPGESPQRDPVRNTPTFPHHHQSFE